MIHSYSKLEDIKKEFVKHWSEKHHTTPSDETNIDWNEAIKKEARGIGGG